MAYEGAEPTPVFAGGTGTASVTAYAPICGGTSSTSAFQSASTGISTSGYVLTSTGSSSLPSFQALSGGGFTWTDVTGGSATLAAQNGYLADSSSLTTFTLPTNNAIGDTIIIMGNNTGGWTIVYGTGQKIVFGNTTTTTTSGNLSSTNGNDSCTLVCTTASATAPIFQVLSSVGNLSVT